MPIQITPSIYRVTSSLNNYCRYVNCGQTLSLSISLSLFNSLSLTCSLPYTTNTYLYSYTHTHTHTYRWAKVCVGSFARIKTTIYKLPSMFNQFAHDPNGVYLLYRASAGRRSRPRRNIQRRCAKVYGFGGTRSPGRGEKNLVV